MIRISKCEADHILYSIGEAKALISDEEADWEGVLDLLESSDEILRACLCNSAVDEEIPDV
jgi:hypothetical protein